MDWDMDDDTLFAHGGERLTITLGVAELVPGTYVYLDADDEIIVRGVLVDDEDLPLARLDFGDEDTDPEGTLVGPLFAPRSPARTTTLVGPVIKARLPMPIPDQIRNETDDDGPGDRTVTGPLIAPRRPAPRRR